MCTRRHRPAPTSRPPTRFLTVCAATYRTNQWLCGRSKAALPAPHGRGRSVPYLRPRSIPAPSDPLQNVLSGRRAQSCPVLGGTQGGGAHTRTDQLGPNFNLRPTHFCPHPRLTDLASHLSLLSPPCLSPFSKDSFNWKSTSRPGAHRYLSLHHLVWTGIPSSSLGPIDRHCRIAPI